MNWRAILPFLSKTKYGKDLDGKPDAEAMERRLDRCGNLCQLGIANLFWKGTTGVFKEMKDNQDPSLFKNIVFFTVCLLLMTMGTVAAMFPETAPFPCFMAGTGALAAIISMFVSYHVDLLAYFPSALYCYISMGLISATFTLYWAYAVQDPWIIHLLARLTTVLWVLICWICIKIFDLLGALWAAICWMCIKVRKLGDTMIKIFNLLGALWAAICWMYIKVRELGDTGDPLLGNR